jgi:MFS family permease
MVMTGLVGSDTERTTAATDAALGLLSLAGALYLTRVVPPSFARRVWQAALLALFLASGLGAIAHGLVMSDTLREALWQPLYLLLGITMALFVVGATDAWRGEVTARRLLLPLLGLALVFYGVTRAARGNFLVFVVFEAAALIFSLVVYLRLAYLRTRRGAGLMALALAVSLLAGMVQASGPISVRLVWAFDHNGLFHLVQLLGVTLLLLGLRRMLGRPDLGTSP